MKNFSPSVDQIITKAQPFAQPVLHYLRELVHAVCPEVEETLKWGMPHFVYRGKNLCFMSSFKNHCAFGSSYQPQMEDKSGLIALSESDGMGSLGKIRGMEDLPSEEALVDFITQAMTLIHSGAKLVRKSVQTELAVPLILAEALKKDDIAAAVFEKFSHSHRREYINWINEAKTDVTKIKRTETTIANLREGKSKEWKYK